MTHSPTAFTETVVVGEIVALHLVEEVGSGLKLAGYLGLVVDIRGHHHQAADLDVRHLTPLAIGQQLATGIEGESILLKLDMHHICVSTGSACSSKSLKPSHVLAALGVSDELIHGTVRFSIGDFTTREDIDYVMDALKQEVEWLRELSPLGPNKGWN